MNPWIIATLTLLVLLILAIVVIVEARARTREIEKANELPVDSEWNWPLRDPRLP